MLQNNFIFLSINKVASNVSIMYKRLYVLVIAEELRLTNVNINVNTILARKLIQLSRNKISSNYVIKHGSKMEKLPLMYYIPKIHKNLVGLTFVVASPNCILKPFSIDITTIFNKIKKCYSKKSNWSGIKRFWFIQNKKPFIYFYFWKVNWAPD